MTKYVLTSEDNAYLRQRKVDVAAMNRHVLWRGRDDVYLSTMRQIYGLPTELHEVVIASFPETRSVVVSVHGPSGVLLLMLAPCEGERNVKVDSLFFSPTGSVPASLMLDVDVQPVIDATEDLFCRVAPPQGGVQ
jgi:hypothetical protein